ncbi:MAG: response regulator [Armatimonadetes bacterium]|nr:response regulator [Armatimonadota bacterium]
MTKAKVLIADDDEDILKAMSLRLKAAGYDVVWAVDAVQAVMRARQEKPDVAVLDVHMPAGDGLAVMDKFDSSEDTIGIPVVLVTADTQASTRDRALAAGVRHYLTKPFETRHLIACVERALATRAGKQTIGSEQLS